MSDNERMRSGDEQVLRVEQSEGVLNKEIVEPLANTLVGQKQQTRNSVLVVTRCLNKYLSHPPYGCGR
jgi:hypothetical protein